MLDDLTRDVSPRTLAGAVVATIALAGLAGWLYLLRPSLAEYRKLLDARGDAEQALLLEDAAAGPDQIAELEQSLATLRTELYGGSSKVPLRVVESHVDAYLQYGSLEVEAYARERGFHDLFERAGIKVLAPGCGACINAGPGVSQEAGQVTVSSINRNFPGRSGPGQVYLASPYTVLASAFEGHIAPYRGRVPAEV